MNYLIIIIIIITNLYSAFRSEDIEALDAAQVPQEDKVSLNRWVFRWRLKVRMFSIIFNLLTDS